jgi:hypothetical protein
MPVDPPTLIRTRPASPAARAKARRKPWISNETLMLSPVICLVLAIGVMILLNGLSSVMPSPRDLLPGKLSVKIIETGPAVVEICNTSGSTWHDVQLTVNGRYRSGHLETLPPAKHASSLLSSFIDEEGNRFDPFRQVVMELEIFADVSEGRGTFTWTRPQ